LQEDHARALRLFEGLQAIGWNCERPQTNMVYVETPGATEVAQKLNEAGVLCFSLSPTRIRLVTHLDVGDPEVEGALEVFKRLR
jgi:threonine aldolase